VAAARLSHLQRRILAWLAQEEQRTRGTMKRQPPGPGARPGTRQG
jgi:hypothetical protein